MSKFNREKKEPEKLNITSLMDALTIILIFLLVNYSEVNEEKEIPKFIELPQVEGEIGKTEFGIVMVIGENKIKVGTDTVIDYSNFENEKEAILAKIGERLDLLKKDKERVIASSPNAKTKKIKISIQADRMVPYKRIDAIIEKATESSLNYIDFVSLNKED